MRGQSKSSKNDNAVEKENFYTERLLKWLKNKLIITILIYKHLTKPLLNTPYHGGNRDGSKSKAAIFIAPTGWLGELCFVYKGGHFYCSLNWGTSFCISSKFFFLVYMSGISTHWYSMYSRRLIKYNTTGFISIFLL